MSRQFAFYSLGGLVGSVITLFLSLPIEPEWIVCFYTLGASAVLALVAIALRDK